MPLAAPWSIVAETLGGDDASAPPMQLVARNCAGVRNTVCSSGRRATEPALVRSPSCDRLWMRRTPYRQRRHRRFARPFPEIGGMLINALRLVDPSID